MSNESFNNSKELNELYETHKFPSKSAEALHNSLAFFSRPVTWLFDVKGTYPSLVGEVSRIEDYITRAVVMLFAGFADKNKLIFAKNPELKRIMESYYKNTFNLGEDEYSVAFVPEPVSKEGILKIVQDARLNSDEAIINFLVNYVQFFGYSEMVFNHIKAALKELHINYNDFKQALRDKGINIDSLDVTGKESPSYKLYFRKALLKFESGNIGRYNLDFTSADKIFESLDNGVVPKWLKGKKRVFVKRADLASGVGVENFDTATDEGIEKLKAHLYSLKQKNVDLAEVLVEEGAELDSKSKEGSLQFYVTKDHKGEITVKFLGVTEQIIEDKEHQGNIISFDKKFVKSLISEEDIEQIQKFIVELSKDTGYQGYISVDFIKDKYGAPKLLEANARITGATMPLAVATYMQLTNPKETIYVASRNTIELDTKKKIDSEKLLKLLKQHDLLFTQEKGCGLIPALVALPEKIGFISVANSKKEALQYIDKVMKILPLKKVYE